MYLIGLNPRVGELTPWNFTFNMLLLEAIQYTINNVTRPYPLPVILSSCLVDATETLRLDGSTWSKKDIHIGRVVDGSAYIKTGRLYISIDSENPNCWNIINHPDYYATPLILHPHFQELIMIDSNKIVDVSHSDFAGPGLELKCITSFQNDTK